ncbi:MAG: hypothetical protein Homavirus6_9 [Homavirus sp.]|uniref:Uncharacterized protein n=1 Tax=Homavirus sp. TaxID=2487769 RepID=A0A3G5A4F2_9VIRU|nr:MAG: hypothetical protein Homavirus6_9 [Homavirus sp.]
MYQHLQKYGEKIEMPTHCNPLYKGAHTKAIYQAYIKMSTIDTSDFVETLLSSQVELSSLEDQPSPCHYCGGGDPVVCPLTDLFGQLEDMLREEVPISSAYVVAYLQDLQSQLPADATVGIFDSCVTMPDEFQSVAEEAQGCADMHRYTRISFEISHFFAHLIKMFESTDMTASHLDQLSCRYTDLFFRE